SKDFPVPEGISWLVVKPKEDGDSSPLSESSSLTKIAVIAGSGAASMTPKKTKPAESDQNSGQMGVSDEAPTDSTAEPEP
ncbi:MAG: hypothetical protein ACREQA_20615, partial [Candidatus Binatia bacterium]